MAAGCFAVPRLCAAVTVACSAVTSACCALACRSAASMALAPSWSVESSTAPCGLAVSVAASAGACEDKQNAAATPAMAGAAATDAPCGNLTFDGLLWRPNGLLSEQDTLTGRCGMPLLSLGAPDVGSLTTAIPARRRSDENRSDEQCGC